MKKKNKRHYHQKTSLASAMKTGIEDVEVGAVGCGHRFCKLKQARTEGISWCWQHDGHDADLVRAT